MNYSFFAVFSVSLTMAAVGSIANDDAAKQAIADVRQLASTGSVAAASEKALRVHQYLARKAGPANCRPSVRITSEMMRRPRQRDLLLDEIESALTSADYARGCQNAMLVGIVMQGEISLLPAAARLSQYEEMWHQEGSPQNPGWFDRLAWANFDAGQFASAERFASQIESSASHWSQKDRPELFLHSARTLLGLARLQTNSASPESAATFLLSSVAFDSPSIVFLGGRPAVRLARALWDKGGTAAVVTYLERLSKWNWSSPGTKDDVLRWLSEAKSGSKPKFVGALTGVYAR